MVATSPEQLRQDALDFFRQADLPEALEWVDALSPVHLRLFVVELADAIKASTLTNELTGLVTLIESWEATAELDASPEVVERINAPKDYRPLGTFTA